MFATAFATVGQDLWLTDVHSGRLYSTCDLHDVGGVEVEHDGSGQDALAQLEQRVQ